MRLRLISAIVLIPAVLLLTWLNEASFAFIVSVCGVLVLLEWLRMVGAGQFFRLRVMAIALLILVAVVAFTQTLAAAAAVTVLGMGALAVMAWSCGSSVDVRWVAAGLLYASAAVVAMIALRKGADGFNAVVFVLFVAWATDTFAFFVGRAIGGPKLWRAVSPSKTWSGAFGGLCAGMVAGVGVALWLQIPLTAWTFYAAGCIAVAAQVGDLLESAAKRRFAVKDAGSLIPGHGGVMDRVDGLVAASLVTTTIGSIVALDSPASGFLIFMGR